MTVEEEIEMHKRVEEHWRKIGLEEKKKRRKLFRQAFHLNNKLIFMHHLCPDGTTGKIILLKLVKHSTLRLDRRALAYYGEKE